MENTLDIVNNYIVILDINGNIKFCNQSLLSKLEYTLEELKGISIDKILYNKNEKLKQDIIYINKNKSLKTNLDFGSKYGNKVLVYSKIIIDLFKGDESIIIISEDLCEKSYKREDLEMILDNLQINCWLKNKNGQYIYVNNSYAKELNDERLNILGKTAKDYWSEEECNSFSCMDKEVIDSKKSQITENNSNKGDSWVEVYKAPIFDENNEVEYILGYTKEITLQKKLENEMYINNKEMNNLNNILMKTNTKNNLHDLLSNIGENIQNYFCCDGLSIVLVNKEKSSLDFTLNLGIIDKYKANDEIFKAKLNKLDKSNEYYIDKIININDVDDSVLKNYMYKNKIENLGIYNIEFNDEIIGFLVLKFLDNNTIKFNKIDYLKTISSNIATMIKSHTLSKEVQKEFNKRKNIENELELLLDISVDLIASGNTSGKIKTVNSNWSKTLGWSEEELLSMNIVDIVHPEYKDEYEDIIQGLSDDTGCVVSKLICKDGNYKWIKLNYKILRSEDKFIITAKDITEEIKKENDRKILEEAIQMESLKNEFFANISHEFRTPLNIILGTMQLMQRNIDINKISWDDSLNLKDHINYIKQNSYRLLRLVNNLIDITRIDSGYYKLHLGNYNIVDIVENITLSVAQYTKDQGINLIFDTNCEEKIIACDPDKIERIVLNLLSNSIKYTGNNGYIYVELHADDEKVKVSVKDNGIGISNDKLNIIFDRFKKIDNSLNRKCEGSGIGLSLAKSLVEIQNGIIYAESELGIGSSFTFELPITLIDENVEDVLSKDISKITQIEKCNIEFSDIYS